MNREAVADRLCHQLNTFESSALSDEQLLALTVLLMLALPTALTPGPTAGFAHPMPHPASGQPLSSWTHRPMTANAHLGGFGIVRPLVAVRIS